MQFYDAIEVEVLSLAHSILAACSTGCVDTRLGEEGKERMRPSHPKLILLPITNARVEPKPHIGGSQRYSCIGSELAATPRW